jgi:hypothetical protein
LGRVGGDTLDAGALRVALDDLVHMLEAALPASLSATVTA